eukprot:483259_1
MLNNTKTAEIHVPSTMKKEHSQVIHDNANEKEIELEESKHSDVKNKIYTTLQKNFGKGVADSFLSIIEELQYDTDGIVDDFDEAVESDIINTIIDRNKHLTKNQKFAILSVIHVVVNTKNSSKPFITKNSELNDKGNQYAIASQISILLTNKYDLHIAEIFLNIIKNEQYDTEAILEDFEDDTTSDIVNGMIDKSSNLSTDQYFEIYDLLKHSLKGNVNNIQSQTVLICSSYERLMKLEKFSSNMLLKMEFSEVSNSNEYNDIEQNIEKYTKQSMVYTEIDLISDEHHVKYCHNDAINITNNKKYMKLFVETTNSINTTCTKYLEYLDQYKVHYACDTDTCFIYNRLKQLADWFVIHGSCDNQKSLKLYLKEKCSYTLYDLKKDQNHIVFCHSGFCDQRVYRCEQADDCCIVNQLANARKHPNDYYFFNMMHGKWISMLAATHKLLYHSKH